MRRVTDRRSGHHCRQVGSGKERKHGGCLLIYWFFEGKKKEFEKKRKKRDTESKKEMTRKPRGKK
jgi:hypothetical protein